MTTTVADRLNDPRPSDTCPNFGQQRLFSIPATFPAVSQFLETLREDVIALQDFPCGPSWEIALAECLNNIVEHAHCGIEQGRIDIRTSVTDRILSVDLRDRGHPMPQGALPAGQLPSLGKETADLPEGGFGWFLILEISENLVYRRENGENRIKFDVPLSD